MKRTISLILALVLVLNLGVYAFAAEGTSLTLSADKTAAALGETVKVTVGGPAYSDMSAMGMNLYFDADASF